MVIFTKSDKFSAIINKLSRPARQNYTIKKAISQREMALTIVRF
jgi:hypothetical protein